MISFLLFSDLHLGASHDGPSNDEKRLETLKRIIRIGMEHDLILIAGDLFHGKPSDELVLEVTKIFSECEKKGIKILISPGENEVGVDGNTLAELLNLPSCFVFSNFVKSNEFFFEKSGEVINIIGMPSNPLAKMPHVNKTEEKLFTVGLFHSEVNLEKKDAETSTMLLSKNDMIKSGIDFFALGHVHNFKIFKHNNNIIGIYPGSCEPFSFEERGDRFAVSVVVVNGRISQIKRMVVNSIVVDEYSFLCDEFDSMQKLLDAIEPKKSKYKAMRIVFRGMRKFLLENEKLENLHNDFFRLVIDDVSEPSLEVLIAQFQNEKSFRGDFFKRLSQELNEGRIPPNIDRDEIARVLWYFIRKKMGK